MVDDLIPQAARTTPIGWLRRRTLWQKGGLALLLLFAILFVNALFATRSGGLKGKASYDSKMAGRAQALGYANAAEMWKTGGGPWAAPKSGLASRSSTNDAAMSPAADYQASAAVGQVSEATQTGAAVPVALDTWGRQLILNATVGLEVADVRAAFNAVQLLAAAQGAVVTAADLQAGPEKSRPYNHATLVLRMPQSRFAAVRQQLANTAADLKGKILQDQVSSEDVTEQYVDLQSRLRHYRSQETQLLAIMSQARKIPDILAVRDQLSAIQQEIERLAGQLRFLQNRVDLSTITVNISPKAKAPVTPPKPPKPTVMTAVREAGQNISAAWIKSLQDLVTVFGMLFIALTYLAPFVLIAIIIWLPVRAARRRTVPGPPASLPGAD